MKKFPPVTTFFLAACFSLTAACTQQENNTDEEADPAEMNNKTEITSPEGSGDGELIQNEPKKSFTVQVETLGNSIEDMRYGRDTIRVNANAMVTVELINRAKEPSMVHNIVFIQNDKMEEVAQAALRAGAEEAYVPDLPAVFAGSGLVEPGETTEFTFTAPFQSGEYIFLCTYPGHWQHMNGTFVVEAVAK